MKFWDSSALEPQLAEEDVTAPLRDLYLAEPVAIVWWSTPVECASAVSLAGILGFSLSSGT